MQEICSRHTSIFNIIFSTVRLKSNKFTTSFNIIELNLLCLQIEASKESDVPHSKTGAPFLLKKCTPKMRVFVLECGTPVFEFGAPLQECGALILECDAPQRKEGRS